MRKIQLRKSGRDSAVVQVLNSKQSTSQCNLKSFESPKKMQNTQCTGQGTMQLHRAEHRAQRSTMHNAQCTFAQCTGQNTKHKAENTEHNAQGRAQSGELAQREKQWRREPAAVALLFDIGFTDLLDYKVSAGLLSTHHTPLLCWFYSLICPLVFRSAFAQFSTRKKLPWPDEHLH